MSYEELLKHAYAIRDKAIEETLEDLGLIWDAAKSQEPMHLGTTQGKSRQEYLDEQRPLVEYAFSYVPELWQPFAEMPDPKSFDPMIAELERAMGILCTVSASSIPQFSAGEALGSIANPKLADVTGADAYLAGWSGSAAMEFRNNVVVRFDPVVHNQYILVAALRAALKAEQAMWAAARRDADAIAHKTLDKLDLLDNYGHKDGFVFGFTVAASVATVIAAAIVPPAGAAAAATLRLTVIGAAAQAVAAAPPGNEIVGPANTTKSIMTAMRESLKGLAHSVGVTEAEIGRVTRCLTDEVDAHRDLFVARRPRLADAGPENVTSDAFLGSSS